MNLNLNGLAAYIASDLRLHIWTYVGVFCLGLIILYLACRLREAHKILAGTEKALDTAVAHTERQAEEIRGWRKFFGPSPLFYETSPELEPGRNHTDMTIAIDLDGVIFEYVDPWNGIAHFGKAKPGTVDAMAKLKSLGYTLVVYTTRNNAMARHNAGHNCHELTALVRSQLENNKIPYDFIALFKPLARYYIDDRAIRFRNWDQALEDLRRHEANRAMRRIDTLGKVLHYESGTFDPHHG